MAFLWVTLPASPIPRCACAPLVLAELNENVHRRSAELVLDRVITIGEDIKSRINTAIVRRVQFGEYCGPAALAASTTASGAQLRALTRTRTRTRTVMHAHTHTGIMRTQYRTR